MSENMGLNIRGMTNGSFNTYCGIGEKEVGR